MAFVRDSRINFPTNWVNLSYASIKNSRVDWQLNGLAGVMTSIKNSFIYWQPDELAEDINIHVGWLKLSGLQLCKL